MSRIWLIVPPEIRVIQNARQHISFWKGLQSAKGREHDGQKEYHERIIIFNTWGTGKTKADSIDIINCACFFSVTIYSEAKKEQKENILNW